LKYRLDKIQRVCSIDIKDFRALLELYCAIRMENFFS
jgi:DNA-binding PucR family transcriptional regulator